MTRVPSRRDDAPPDVSAAGIGRGMVWLLAVACGLAVANLYYAQPLLSTIAHALHTGSGTAGLVVTTTQLGYAAGLLLLVPLGDLVERRGLVVALLGVTAAALVAASLAPDVLALALALAVAGLTSVVAQVLVPFAANLAADDERGRVVGTVMSGLLVGILLARTVSGLLAGVTGWRPVYLVAAGLMLVLAAVLWRRLPRSRERAELGYGALLASVLALVRAEPVLRRRMLLGGLLFGAFSIFWTSVAFLLAGPSYRWSEAEIGLLGLLGIAGALCAQAAGRLADRGRQRAATLGFTALTLASFGVLALGGHHALAVMAGVLTLDAGVQGTHITNQSLVYALAPDARSRLTAAYMTAYFAGGAAGSAASAQVYAAAGWSGVWALGTAVSAVGLVAALLPVGRGRRPALR